MKNDVFISYNRDQDLAVAKALEQGLKRFARPFHRLRPALRVFRDETNFQPDASLLDAIEKELLNSRYMVLLASKASAKSSWVKKEIATFLENCCISFLIIVLTDGDITWDQEKNDFDWKNTNALPKKEVSGFYNKGIPNYIDLRWIRDTEDLSLNKDRFLEEFVKIAAKIHGKNNEELYGEEHRQRNRSLILGWSTSVVLFLLLVCTGLFAKYAVIQRDIALSRELAARSEARLSANARDSAQLALEAIKKRPTKEAEIALRKSVLGPLPRVTAENVKSFAINADETCALFILRDSKARLVDLETGFVMAAFSLPALDFSLGGFHPDKKEGYFAVADDLCWLAVASPNRDVFIVDTSSGKILYKYHDKRGEATEPASRVESSSFSVHPIRDKGYMILEKENPFNPIKLLRPSLARPSLEPSILNKAQLPPDTFVLAVVASPDHRRVLVCREDGIASLHEADGGQLVKTFVGDGGRVRGGGFSPDGETLVTCGMKGKAFVWHISSGELQVELKDDSGYVGDSYFSPRGNYVVSLHGSSRKSKGRVNIWPANWRSRRMLDSRRGVYLKDARLTEGGEAVLVKSNDRYFRLVTDSGVMEEVDAGQWHRLSADDERFRVLISGHLATPYDAVSGKRFDPIELLDDRFASAKFSPDGNFLIGAIQSGKGSRAPLHYAGIWEIETGEFIYRLSGPRNLLRSASFSPDGSKAVVVCDDGKVWIFNTPAFITINALVELVSRRLEHQARWLEVSFRGGTQNEKKME